MDSAANKITKNTLMPIGMVIGLVTAVLVCQGWLNEKFSDQKKHIDSKFEETTTRFGKVEQRLYELERATSHRWDSLDMRGWVLDLKTQNPELQIPIVTESINGNNDRK